MRTITTSGVFAMTAYRVFAALLVAACCAARAAPADAWSTLESGDIVLMRHAEAPGIGDPPAFTLGQCSTQRNLNDAGRARARRIGEAFRSHSIDVSAVVASQWCRTHDTAELAFPGQVRDDARFNSFFDGASDETAQTRRAKAWLSEWHGPGVLVVVTHQVNITALTGVVPAAGEGVVVRPSAGRLQVIGRLQP